MSEFDLSEMTYMTCPGQADKQFEICGYHLKAKN